MTKWTLLLGLLLCAWLVPMLARADEAQPVREQAAQQFDAGVRAFQMGAFEAAASAFLRADDIAPSAIALRNALSAAQRAQAPLLTLHAATRLLSRVDLAAPERAAAESARSAAEAQTALLELGCDAAECALALDGEAAQPGEHRVLPGVHQVTSQGRALHVECVAGERCRASFAAERAEQPVAALPAAPPVDAPSAGPRRSREQRAALGTFLGLSASAVVFGGVTVWSGLQALNARDLHKDNPPAYDPAEVERLGRRTDLLLASSLLLAAGAAATALWWVDFGGGAQTQLVLLPGGGAGIRSFSRF